MDSNEDPVLRAMHVALCDQLLKRVKSGEATAADFNVARAFLKDNNISAVPVKNSPLGNLADGMPDFESEDAIPKH